MIISSVNYFALLPCLCVLCVLFMVGIAVMSAILAKARKTNGKIMQNDVYMRDIAVLNVDCDQLSDDCADKAQSDSEVTDACD